MTSLPSKMRALKAVSGGQPGKAELQQVSLPSLRPGYVLIKVHAVALNPTDWKHIDFLNTPGCTVGCDAAGTIEAISDKDVTKSLKVGDRVAGFTHGVNKVEPEDGAFADYALLKADMVVKLPSSLSYEDASTMGVGINTVNLGPFVEFGLPYPSPEAQLGNKSKDGEFILVYGGSTATGTLAVEYLSLAGLRVLSANGPHNDKLVLGRGAEKCFDYNDKDVSAKIRDYTGGKLTKVFDTISSGESPEISAKAIGDNGGQIVFLLPVEKVSRSDVKIGYVLAYTSMGEAFEFGPRDFPAKPQDFEHAKKFAALTESLLAKGTLKLHPHEVREGGLDKVLEGLDDLRNNKVSGKKIVYTFA